MPSATGATPSGNRDIDGLLWGDKWDSPNLTYLFPASDQAYLGQYTVDGFEAINPTQQAALLKILANYDAVSGLSFTLSQDPSHATLRFGEATTITYNDPRDPLPHTPGHNGNTAEGNPPDVFSGSQQGDVWLAHTTFDDPQAGSYAYFALTHEIGHAVGLKHGHTPRANGLGETFPTLPANHDSFEYSIMTYHQYIDSPIDKDRAFEHPTTLMQDDIAALQYLYGADYGTHNGDTEYQWSTATGELFINGQGQGKPVDSYYGQPANYILMTVWDGGGTDTYDFSNYTTNLKIDLRAGAWSTVDRAQLADLGSIADPVRNTTDNPHFARGNIANAQLYHNDDASLIENAVGGSGNDTITGNSADNELHGGSGADTLSGLYGDDVLDGGPGADVMQGGYGNDFYVVDNANDQVIEPLLSAQLIFSGTDTVLATVSYTLPTRVDNLILDGADPIDGYGNSLDNMITGNSNANRLDGHGGNDILDGGGGGDLMNGEAGRDLYFVDNPNDVVIESGGFRSGIDTVVTSIDNYVLPNHVENLILQNFPGVTEGIGNGQDNVITGNSYDNSLLGGAGDDILDGGLGADTMWGGFGNDAYYVDNTGDRLMEEYILTPNGIIATGHDTAFASVSYTIPFLVEDLYAAVRRRGDRRHRELG